MFSALNSKSKKKDDSRSSSSASWTRRARRLPPGKRLIKLVGRATFWWLSLTAGLLRPWSIRLIGNTLGSTFYFVSRRYRTIAHANLRAAFPQKTDREIASTAREVFRHFSREALQFFYLLSLSRDEVDALVDVDGIENLDGTLEQGKGCIGLTAHYGNWELMARKLALMGYPINVIARDSDDPGMTGITTRIRESGGYRVFDNNQPIIGAFRRLRNNEILGILPDQNDIHGIPADFFGRPAATATGPAVLSLRSGAPVVPSFARRLDSGRYMLTIYPPIDFTPTGDEERDIRELTVLINAAIEREVRSNPSQWLWLHDRWKLSPEVKRDAS